MRIKPFLNNSNSSEQILGSREAAAFLGISLYQIYHLSRNGRLPTYSPTGGKIYFLKSELEAWIISGRRADVKMINSRVISILNKI